MSASTRSGLFCAVAANVIWGLFPIFWSLLKSMPAIELVCYRILWACAFSLAIAAVRFRFSSKTIRVALIEQFRSGQTWATFGIAAVLIAINWGAFLYAVTNDQVLLSALGYYISPLLNVLLGVMVLGERLGIARRFAVGLATSGVVVMTFAAGQAPWVSLVMASSFAGYALVKKKANLDPLYGLLLETLVLLVPTLIYLGWATQSGQAPFGSSDPSINALLVVGGLMTLLPLALFAAAAQRIPLTLIGILQYIGPTLQFLIGAFYFDEPLSTMTIVGFAFVWSAVAVFLLTKR